MVTGEETRYKDKTGRVICVGDIFAYATKYTGGNVAIYRCVGQSEYKMRVVRMMYGNQRPSFINSPSDALVLSGLDTSNEALEKLM